MADAAHPAESWTYPGAPARAGGGQPRPPPAAPAAARRSPARRRAVVLVDSDAERHGEDPGWETPARLDRIPGVEPGTLTGLVGGTARGRRSC
ncbi:MAG: hypothetical protein R2749_02555 [Acidimicrobiales bacterium]